MVLELNKIDSENYFNFEKGGNEIKITNELKSEEIKDDFSDCHLLNY